MSGGMRRPVVFCWLLAATPSRCFLMGPTTPPRRCVRPRVLGRLQLDDSVPPSSTAFGIVERIKEVPPLDQNTSDQQLRSMENSDALVIDANLDGEPVRSDVDEEVTSDSNEKEDAPVKGSSDVVDGNETDRDYEVELASLQADTGLVPPRPLGRLMGWAKRRAAPLGQVRMGSGVGMETSSGGNDLDESGSGGDDDGYSGSGSGGGGGGGGGGSGGDDDEASPEGEEPSDELVPVPRSWSEKVADSVKDAATKIKDNRGAVGLATGGASGVLACHYYSETVMKQSAAHSNLTVVNLTRSLATTSRRADQFSAEASRLRAAKNSLEVQLNGARAAKASCDQRLADTALLLATSDVERQQLRATVSRLNDTVASLEADVKAAKLAAEAAKHGKFSNEEMTAVLEDELMAERERAVQLEQELAAGAEREAASADELQRALTAAEELKDELKAMQQGKGLGGSEGGDAANSNSNSN